MRVTDWMTCDSVPQMLAAKIKKRGKKIHCNSHAGRLLQLQLCRILKKRFLTATEQKDKLKSCVCGQTIASMFCQKQSNMGIQLESHYLMNIIPVFTRLY